MQLGDLRRLLGEPNDYSGRHPTKAFLRLQTGFIEDLNRSELVRAVDLIALHYATGDLTIVDGVLLRILLAFVGEEHHRVWGKPPPKRERSRG